jgi:hypothetical protein
VDPVMALIGMGGGFQFEAPGNVRDVRWLGDVQQGTTFSLCQFLCACAAKSQQR